MKLKAEVETAIPKKCKNVFGVIINPEKMSNYFISSGTDCLAVGKRVIWKWNDIGAELPIKVLRADEDTMSIAFLWSARGVETKVEISLEAAGEGTVVKVTEDGWMNDDEGIKRYGQQIQGWVHMITCMKAYHEFGINLRTGIKV
jgi:uncharacterized protein YndB with AHSA1/START domain